MFGQKIPPVIPVLVLEVRIVVETFREVAAPRHARRFHDGYDLHPVRANNLVILSVSDHGEVEGQPVIVVGLAGRRLGNYWPWCRPSLGI